MKPTRFSFTAITLLILLPVAAGAQGTRADYQRATGLRERYESLAINVPGRRRPGSTKRAGSGTGSPCRAAASS
jgi:hypothetical protein